MQFSTPLREDMALYRRYIVSFYHYQHQQNAIILYITNCKYQEHWFSRFMVMGVTMRNCIAVTVFASVLCLFMSTFISICYYLI